MNLFDTNVLLDIAKADPVWLPWSEKQLRAAAARGPILINPIIYAEMAPAFASASDLDQWLDPTVFQRLPLPYPAGWIAAQAFVKYRRSGGVKTSPLPDFYIGAHAELEALTLTTRGSRPLSHLFPERSASRTLNLLVLAPRPCLTLSEVRPPRGLAAILCCPIE